jgi:putative aldouronate transport system substrate-binding protein
MRKLKVSALLLSLILLIGSEACSSNTITNKQMSDKMTSSVQNTGLSQKNIVKEENTTLKVLTNNPTDWNNYPDNPVAKELKKQIGVTVEFEVADMDKIKVILSAGDLPDIVMARNDSNNQQFKQLIEGNNIIPLDDLLQKIGKNILKTEPTMVDFSKKYYSNGTNNLYYLTVGIGKETAGIEQSIGPVIRWDYYKELGYPEIKNQDDLLNVLAQMVQKHPLTPEGKKVSAVGIWSDWGSYCLGMIMGIETGYSGFTKLGETTYLPTYSMTNGPFWSGVSFLYKAHKMGILDPDALIMGYEDLHIKCTNGQILYSVANWPFDNFNGAHNIDAQGYMALPLDWAGQWYGTNWDVGYTNKGYCISKNCKAPEKAMELFNYLWSYDGARLVFSGVKGVHWDVIDGKPVEKDEFVKLRTEGGDPWMKLKIHDNGSLNGLVGLNPYTINPTDHAPMSLFDTEEVYNNSLNPLQKDFSDHYGVKYPAQAFTKLVAEGKVKNQSSYNPYIEASMPPQPDNIKTIAAKIEAAIISASEKCILSQSDAEYETNMKKAIDDINALGYGKFNAWYSKAWNDAKIVMGVK